MLARDHEGLFGGAAGEVACGREEGDGKAERRLGLSGKAEGGARSKKGLTALEPSPVGGRVRGSVGTAASRGRGGRAGEPGAPDAFGRHDPERVDASKEQEAALPVAHEKALHSAVRDDGGPRVAADAERGDLSPIEATRV